MDTENKYEPGIYKATVSGVPDQIVMRRKCWDGWYDWALMLPDAVHGYTCTADREGIVTDVRPMTLSEQPVPCVMTHTPPMDFAQCETHDETFPLGSTCPFYGVKTEDDLERLDREIARHEERHRLADSAYHSAERARLFYKIEGLKLARAIVAPSARTEETS